MDSSRGFFHGFIFISFEISQFDLITTFILRLWKYHVSFLPIGQVFLFIYFELSSIFYCCAELGYIVAFTKVLTMYQIYHSWIHPLHHSLLSPYPHSWNSFNRYHFPFTCMCTQYLHHIHPPSPFPHLLTHPTDTTLPRQDLFHPLIL
jgi:hypothetical protein